MRLKKPHFTALQKMRGTNLKKRKDKFKKNWKSLANPVPAPGLIGNGCTNYHGLEKCIGNVSENVNVYKIMILNI